MQQMGGSSGDPLRQMECGGLFKTPKAPALQPVTRMPDEKDPAVLEAQARKRQQIASRGGRTSTVMTGGGDSTGAYRNSLLGQS